MHIDGIESMHVALYEISPCKTNGILLANNYCNFWAFYVNLGEGKTHYTLGVTF